MRWSRLDGRVGDRSPRVSAALHHAGVRGRPAGPHPIKGLPQGLGGGRSSVPPTEQDSGCHCAVIYESPLPNEWL